MYKYSIYQLKDAPETLPIRFSPLQQLQSAGFQVDKQNYNFLYSGTIKRDNSSVKEILDAIFYKFNIDRPADFKGHSLSVSDVIVLEAEAFYVDSIGFVEVPEFLTEQAIEKGES